MMRWIVVATVAVTVLLPMATWAQVTAGKYAFIFEEQCAVCHGTTSLVPNAVSREALRAFSPERVLESLTTGGGGSVVALDAATGRQIWKT